VDTHCWVIFYKFKKTIRNEKWEKVKILKKQLKKHLLKLQKKKKQKRDLKKLIDNYTQGSGSGDSINELILHKKKWYKDILNETLPFTQKLYNAYPNPFNPITTLRYDLPENSLVTITIYDMLGRQVKTLMDQTQEAGYRSVIWDATNDYGKPVSAGIYLYQIQAGEFMQTKKMVLLK